MVSDAIFLSTLSLRRATDLAQLRLLRRLISIHALLAESDDNDSTNESTQTDFYPRSPCGERPQAILVKVVDFPISIHALLAESDPGW